MFGLLGFTDQGVWGLWSKVCLGVRFFGRGEGGLGFKALLWLLGFRFFGGLVLSIFFV